MKVLTIAVSTAILLLFSQACTLSKKRTDGLYRGFGNLGHNYVSLDKDLQVPFVANHQFFENPGRKDFKKLELPSSIVRLLAVDI